MMNRRRFLAQSAIAAGSLWASTQSAPVFGSPLSVAPFTVSPDWEKKGTPFKHTWRGLGNVDQMRWILRGDMQAQLKMCRDEIGLKHVRAVGIFDDDLYVYDRDPQNFHKKDLVLSKRYNWRVPFYIFDTLVETGLSPMITPSFMPTALASGVATVFETKNNVTPPRDWKEWERMIRQFVGDLANHYGTKTLEGWYFEAWNEPNLDGFWTGGKEGYWELYRILFEAAKSVSPGIKIGGPSTARSEWVGEFIEFCDRKNMQPDYIIGHCYNNDSASQPLSPFEGPQKDKENNSPNFTKGVVKGIKKMLNGLNYRGEFHMNEWGLSWYPYRLERETPNEAAFIVKTMAEVSQEADYHAYWCLSDIYNQAGYGKEAFHGNYGMLSLDGLRKPAYMAHQLLSLLGTEQVPLRVPLAEAERGALATRSGKNFQVACYDFDMGYTVDAPIQVQPFEVYLPKSVRPESVQLYRIDEQENNIVKKWKEMGSPAYLKSAELAQLKAFNAFSPSTEKIKVQKTANGFLANFNLKGPGVALLVGKEG